MVVANFLEIDVYREVQHAIPQYIEGLHFSAEGPPKWIAWLQPP